MGCARIADETWPPGPAALIGRERETRRMIALLGAAAPGQPSVLVVEGPPGSGRRRLLRELVAVARERGVTVVPEHEWAGTALPAGTSPGLLLVSDQPPRFDPGLCTTVHRLAGSAPVLVAFAARTGSDRYLLPPEACRIRLAPLPDGDVERFVGHTLAVRPGPDLLELTRVAAGRPGALLDLIAGLREEDLLKVAGGRAGLHAVRLPGRTVLRLREQLAAMSPQARHLLQAATTLRSPFPLIRLTRLLHVSPVSLLAEIDEVLESSLLIGHDELLGFSHDLVRPIVRSSMPRSVVAALRAEQRPGPVRRRITPAAPRPPRVPPPSDWTRLTAREREVAELVGLALTNQQIAGRLGRSPHTVNFHLRRIFEKLGLTSRVELASLARQRETTSGPSSS